VALRGIEPLHELCVIQYMRNNYRVYLVGETLSLSPLCAVVIHHIYQYRPQLERLTVYLSK